LLSNDILRMATIGALAQLGDHSVVSPLALMLDQAVLVPIVVEALVSLHQRYESQLGEGGFVADLVSSNITPAGVENLLNALNTTTGAVLRSVVRVLGWIGGEHVIVRLTLLLGSPSLHSEVIETFVRHGARVTGLLDQQLDAGDLDTRTAAVV